VEKLDKKNTKMEFDLLDFSPVRLKEKTLDDLAANLTLADLHKLTDEMVDTMLALVEEAVNQDVTFEPEDPEAFDSFTDIAEEVHMPWTLGHVIVHITASAEEAAAQSATLARGIKYRGRSRYEMPWRSVKAADDLRHRLEESRRMRHAFLQAWPDEPHLENTFTPKYPGALPRNAITYFLSGLMHDDAHLGQIEEIMGQARRARVEELNPA
jgi:hypothetical protein